MTSTTTRRRSAKFQIEFIAFPGVKPSVVQRGWPHLPLPWSAVAEEAEIDEISDACMMLADYAIDNAPEAFGFDFPMDDYDEPNQLSIDICGAIFDATEGRQRVQSTGGAWAEWWQDVQLADGIVVRVAYFA